jgi:hypothetical protein
MSIRYYIVLIFTLATTVTTAQQQGYIIIDSVYATGVIYEQGRALGQREIKFAKSAKSQVTTYYPATVKEYGYSKKKYVTRKILTGDDSTAYFLRVITSGKTQLYTVKLDGKKRFFLENALGIVELKKANHAYQETISNRLTACETAKRYTPHLNFSEKALRRYVKLYDQCYNAAPWPLARWGVTAGYAITDMEVTDVFGEKVKISKSSPFVGALVDLPIGTNPNWFINMQATFHQSNFETRMSKYISAGIYHDFKYSVKISTLSLPVMVKYRFPGKNLRGFFSAGTSMNYHFKSESKMVEELSPGQNISNKDLVKKNQVNGIIGAGIESSLNEKNSVAFEVRYNKGGNPGKDGQKVKAIQLSLTYYF